MCIRDAKPQEKEQDTAAQLTRCRGWGTALHCRQNSQKSSKTHKTKFVFRKPIKFSTQLCQKDEGDGEKEADYCTLVSIHKTSVSNSTSIWLHLETQHQQLQLYSLLSFFPRLKLHSENGLSVTNDRVGMKNINHITRGTRGNFISIHQHCAFSGVDRDTLWKTNTNAPLQEHLSFLHQWKSQCCQKVLISNQTFSVKK